MMSEFVLEVFSSRPFSKAFCVWIVGYGLEPGYEEPGCAFVGGCCCGISCVLSLGISELLTGAE